MLTWYADIDIMKKVLVRLFVVFCLVASSLLAAPFSVSADTSVTITTSNILGVYVDDNGRTGSSLTIVFDNEYIGTIQLRMSVIMRTDYDAVAENRTEIITFYVNGRYGFGSQAGSCISATISAITSQNLKLKNDSEIVYNFSYRDVTAYTYWSNHGMTVTDTYTVPALYISSFSNATKYSDSGNYIRMSKEDLYIAFYANKNNDDNDLSVFIKSTSPYTLTIERYRTDQFNGYSIGSFIFQVVRIHLNEMDTDPENVTLDYSRDRYIINWGEFQGSAVRIIPVYMGGISTMSDDMRRFLVFDEVQSSAENLDNTTSDFSESSSDLFNYEDTFNNSMNQSLQNINVQFDVGNQFGSKFLASAQWVKTQFDTLTSTSPFGTLLSFSLILGIALLIIGKAVK